MPQKRSDMQGGVQVASVVYVRGVFYYETDRMDCVHHSNYIRWFEEARVHFMQEMGFPYEGLEAAGIVSPVLSVEARYQSMCRFGDTVEVLVRLESYTRTRIAFGYQVRDRATGQPRCQGRTTHCFINRAGRPVSLAKAMPSYHQLAEAAVDKEGLEWQT
ncbi:acyl-CoA thioesterase [Acutalibacter caecimuris]|uniref:acyl-CoA thioesterase n=1 Tax=Acutalibacter caecimuris TaxID=3093657 RepID=UPI002AC91E9B|nr:thioesterase family protein [Acutalibacter sp. M00118]